jgi:hypothetical protein
LPGETLRPRFLLISFENLSLPSAKFPFVAFLILSISPVPAHNETCPKCGAEMRIISFIFDKAVLQKILTHLGVFEQNSKQRAPPAPAQR